MKPIPKQKALQLSPEDYCTLCRQVLERDDWRCQKCGARTNLQVHHIQHRVHSGPDEIENLKTLCAACHRSIHNDDSR